MNGAAGPLFAGRIFRWRSIEGLFAELAQLQQDLTRTLAVPAAKQSVEVYLFRNEQTYRTYLEARLPQVPYRRALFVKGSGPGRIFAYKSKE